MCAYICVDASRREQKAAAEKAVDVQEFITYFIYIR